MFPPGPHPPMCFMRVVSCTSVRSPLTTDGATTTTTAPTTAPTTADASNSTTPTVVRSEEDSMCPNEGRVSMMMTMMTMLILMILRTLI
mmetsp:Transcript_26655/g.29952  ORF Transcript_26655/g.29952 Transcript_26655/m.29952 type:complete len:89 (+) Transcript_26655:141-407(+)